MSEDQTPYQDPTPSQDRLAQGAESIATATHAIVSYFKAREAREQKAQTWKSLSRGVFAVILISFFAFWLIFYGRMFGVNINPARADVAIIPVSGPIASRGDASAEVVVPMIESACSSMSVATVVLEINSPGGSPSEAERIVDAIEACRAEHGKQIVALIDQLGASAGYMIAIRADRIIAGRYTLVGSIGAIMRYIDASEAASRLGLREQIFKSGTLKGGPTNLSGGDEALDAVNQEMVVELGRTFLEDVFEHREESLNVDREYLFSGRIWAGEEALKIGLIDEIGTFESLSAGEWKELRVQRYKAKSGVARGMGFSAAVADWLTIQMQNLSAPRLE